MDLNKLTTEQINGYSAAEGVKALETLRQESLSPMQINEALLIFKKKGQRLSLGEHVKIPLGVGLY